MSKKGAAAAPAKISSDAIRSAIKESDLPYPLKLGPEKNGDDSYAFLDATTFSVRGKNYLKDNVKAHSVPAVFDLMSVELFRSEDKIGNIAQRKDSFLRRARAAGDTRYYLVILYVTPSAPYVHVGFYYAVNQDKVDALPHFKKMWTRFTAEGPDGDAFRNERWKVIPRIAEGSWIVQSAVGTKPALLAQKLTHTWILAPEPMGAAAAAASAASSSKADGGKKGEVKQAPVVETSDSDAACGAGGHRVRGESFISYSGPGPYLESDCDVSSSSVAQMLVGLLQSYAKNLVIDLGFAIEPREDEECPEVVLGAVRLSHLNVDRPAIIPADAADWVLGSLGVTHSDPGATAIEGATEVEH